MMEVLARESWYSFNFFNIVNENIFQSDIVDKLYRVVTMIAPMLRVGYRVCCFIGMQNSFATHFVVDAIIEVSK